MMGIEETLKLLDAISNEECTCVEVPKCFEDYILCRSCTAGEAINAAAEELSQGYKEVLEKSTDTN